MFALLFTMALGALIYAYCTDQPFRRWTNVKGRELHKDLKDLRRPKEDRVLPGEERRNRGGRPPIDV
jgi:hypothetical protein